MTVRPTTPFHIPPEILALSQERDELRRKGKYDRADELKRRIEEAGYGIKDNPRGAHLIILPRVEIDGTLYGTTRQVPSLLDATDSCTFSVNVLAGDELEQTRRCIESIFRFAGAHTIEVVLVNDTASEGVDAWASTFRAGEPRLHLVSLTRKIGQAEARNLALKRSRGRYILVLNNRVELVGDLFTPLADTLADSEIGVTGLHGLVTSDMRHFEETGEPEAEVIDAMVMAFRRKLLKRCGLFDERYRYPDYMDSDFSFAIRDCGKRAVVTPDLPVQCSPEVEDDRLSEAERNRLNRRNYYRFLDKWGHREDLLLDFE